MKRSHITGRWVGGVWIRREGWGDLRLIILSHDRLVSYRWQLLRLPRRLLIVNCLCCYIKEKTVLYRKRKTCDKGVFHKMNRYMWIKYNISYNKRLMNFYTGSVIFLNLTKFFISKRYKVLWIGSYIDILAVAPLGHYREPP